MPTLSHEDLFKSLKKGEFAPVYLLHGEESFYVDKIGEYIENHALTESERSFNQTVLYGKDVDSQAVMDNARRYPVMAARQLVVIREAQSMKDIEQLEKYVSQPASSTILVLCYKHAKYDARKKLAKLIAEKGIVMESKRLYDNQIPAWIGEYFKQNNYQVEPDARELLAEYLGTELSRVSNELDKLMLALPKGTTINKKHIEENIGISKDFNIFELQTALARKDDFKCLQIVEFFGTNLKDNPLVVVIGSLYGFFSKLLIAQTCRQGSDKDMIAAIFPNEDANQWQRLSWKLRDYKTGLQHFNRKQTEDAISLLHEYDMRVKGVNNDSTPESELMREMVLRMLI